MRCDSFVLVACLTCSPLLAQDPTAAPTDAVVSSAPDEQPLDFWMQKKLDYSTEILKGLSLGSFDLIESNARQMRLLNRIEGFVHSRNSSYRTHVHTFELATNEVIRQANKESIDGVTLAYHQLTVSCVRCHQSLREPDTESQPFEIEADE